MKNTSKVNICFFLIFLFIYTTLLYSEENIEKYEFSLYLLIKGKLVKNIKRYDFGYRIEKTFPLRVKEFLLSSKYHNSGNPKIKDIAENIILANINPEYRRKNAYYVTSEIFNYIKNKIENDNLKEEFNLNVHNLFRYPSEVIKEGKGNLLEKCRLAVALCRYLIIPARIAYWNNHYVVEYYLQPLKEKGRWFIMDFESDDIQIKDEFIRPVEWFPIDKDEQLNEEWNGNEIYLKRKNIIEMIFTGDDNLAKEKFEKFKNDEKIEIDENINRNFYILRKINYEIWFEGSGDKKAKIKFNLPFNNRSHFKKENSNDDFKTMAFFVKSENDELNIKYKRAYTRINPPQIGITYSLPVEFSIKK